MAVFFHVFNFRVIFPFLMFQNTRDTGTSTVTRKCRNLLAAALEE